MTRVQGVCDELSGVCKASWGPEDQTIIFKCRDCGLHPTSCVCMDCFLAADHTGHDFSFVTGGWGMCDCGNVDSFIPGGFCDKHQGPPDKPENVLPDWIKVPVRNVAHSVVELLLDRVEERFELVSNLELPEDVVEKLSLDGILISEIPETIHFNSLSSTDNSISPLLDLLKTMSGLGVGPVRIIADSLRSKEFVISRPQWVGKRRQLVDEETDGFRAMMEFVKYAFVDNDEKELVRGVFYNIVTDIQSRVAIAENFVDMYSDLAFRNTYSHPSSSAKFMEIRDLSVQFFTSRNVFQQLTMKDVDPATPVLQALGALIDKSVTTTGLKSPFFEDSSYYMLIHDIQYMLHEHVTSHEIMYNPISRMPLIRVFAASQGLVPLREERSRFEFGSFFAPNDWVHGVNFNYHLRHWMPLIIEGFLLGDTVLDPTIKSSSKDLEEPCEFTEDLRYSIREILSEFAEPITPINDERAEMRVLRTSDFEEPLIVKTPFRMVLSSQVSLWNPLHRMYSGLLSETMRHWKIGSLKAVVSPRTIKLVAETAIQSLSAGATVLARYWPGMRSTERQVDLQASTLGFVEPYLSDLYLVQATASEETVPRLLNESGMYEYFFTDEGNAEIALVDDDELKLERLVSELLLVIGRILLSRAMVSDYMTLRNSLRRSIAHVLFTKGRAQHSEVLKEIPRHFQDDDPNLLDEILGEVAVFSEGHFKPKKTAWSLFEGHYYTGYSIRESVSAMENLTDSYREGSGFLKVFRRNMKLLEDFPLARAYFLPFKKMALSNSLCVVIARTLYRILNRELLDSRILEVVLDIIGFLFTIPREVETELEGTSEGEEVGIDGEVAGSEEPEGFGWSQVQFPSSKDFVENANFRIAPAGNKSIIEMLVDLFRSEAFGEFKPVIKYLFVSISDLGWSGEVGEFFQDVDREVRARRKRLAMRKRKRELATFRDRRKRVSDKLLASSSGEESFDAVAECSTLDDIDTAGKSTLGALISSGNMLCVSCHKGMSPDLPFGLICQTTQSANLIPERLNYQSLTPWTPMFDLDADAADEDTQWLTRAEKFLFSSVKPCGHAVHSSCIMEYRTKVDKDNSLGQFVCPLDKKPSNCTLPVLPFSTDALVPVVSDPELKGWDYLEEVFDGSVVPSADTVQATELLEAVSTFLGQVSLFLVNTIIDYESDLPGSLVSIISILASQINHFERYSRFETSVEISGSAGTVMLALYRLGAALGHPDGIYPTGGPEARSALANRVFLLFRSVVEEESRGRERIDELEEPINDFYRLGRFSLSDLVIMLTALGGGGERLFREVMAVAWEPLQRSTAGEGQSYLARMKIFHDLCVSGDSRLIRPFSCGLALPGPLELAAELMGIEISSLPSTIDAGLPARGGLFWENFGTDVLRFQDLHKQFLQYWLESRDAFTRRTRTNIIKCLVTGKNFSSEQTSELNRHVANLGGRALFLVIVGPKSSSIAIVYSDRDSDISFVGSLYKDIWGEFDIGIHRGKQLTLDEDIFLEVKRCFVSKDLLRM